MYATSVGELKKDPSLALRHAKDGPVVILEGTEPAALLVHLEGLLDDAAAGVPQALAASLYRDGCVSLGKAAKISGLSLSAFVDHLASLGIEVTQLDETTAGETKDVSRWLSS